MKNKKVKQARQPVAPLQVINGIEPPVTSEQLAKHLQVTTRSLANYRKAGKIPYWKLNARNFRYRISAVEIALANAR